jgi:hypothetical protein
MPKSIIGYFIILVVLILVLMTGCNPSTSSRDPAASVEAYFQALKEKDVNRMIDASCADWEAQAKQEFDSFAAVELTFEDLSCVSASQDNDNALVTCTGVIIANYGAEDLEIDVADRTYQVVQEAGDWRMCGYQQ